MHYILVWCGGFEVCLCLGSLLSAGKSLWKTSLLYQLTPVSRETDACWQRKMLLFLLVERCCDIKATPAGVVWVYKRCVMSFISPPAICLDGENQNVFLLPMMGKVCQPLFVCLSWKSQISTLIVAEEEIEIAKNSFICSLCSWYFSLFVCHTYGKTQVFERAPLQTFEST